MFKIFCKFFFISPILFVHSLAAQSEDSQHKLLEIRNIIEEIQATPNNQSGEFGKIGSVLQSLLDASTEQQKVIDNILVSISSKNIEQLFFEEADKSIELLGMDSPKIKDQIVSNIYKKNINNFYLLLNYGELTGQPKIGLQIFSGLWSQLGASNETGDPIKLVDLYNAIDAKIINRNDSVDSEIVAEARKFLDKKLSHQIKTAVCEDLHTLENDLSEYEKAEIIVYAFGKMKQTIYVDIIKECQFINKEIFIRALVNNEYMKQVITVLEQIKSKYDDQISKIVFAKYVLLITHEFVANEDKERLQILYDSISPSMKTLIIANSFRFKHISRDKYLALTPMSDTLFVANEDEINLNNNNWCLFINNYFYNGNMVFMKYPRSFMERTQKIFGVETDDAGKVYFTDAEAENKPYFCLNDADELVFETEANSNCAWKIIE